MSRRNNSLNRYKDKAKVGDFVFFCDTCGNKAWYSEATKQDKYTGLGGTLVCRDCVDGIVHTFVPFVIEPEKNIPDARVNHYANNATPLTSVFHDVDYTTSPPTVIYASSNSTIDQITVLVDQDDYSIGS